MSAFNLPCVLGGSRDYSAFREILFLNCVPLLLILFAMCVCLPSFVFPAIRKFKPPNVTQGCNLTLSILQAFFITIINFSLNLVFNKYEHPMTGKFSLVVYPYLLTDDREVHNMYIVAGLALSLWCIGTYCVFILCVITRARRPHWLMFQRCTMATAIKYRDATNSWVLVDMLVKMVLCTAPLFTRTPEGEMQVIGALFTAYWCLMMALQPYRYSIHYCNDVVLTSGRLIVVMCSATCLMRDNSDGSPILCVTAFICCWVFFVMVRCLTQRVIFNVYMPHTDNKQLMVFFLRLSKFSPLQPAWDEYVAGSFNNTEKIQRKFVQKMKFDAYGEHNVIQCLPDMKQKQYMQLRSSQLECLVQIACGNGTQSKTLMEQQKQMISALCQ
mmetsp:Transcript_178/g.357  ORF Transcript_178/g.357 Transcript_178/m.357 type:complete len:385 (+) Transcript_178:2767-3921(+)